MPSIGLIDSTDFTSWFDTPRCYASVSRWSSSGWSLLVLELCCFTISCGLGLEDYFSTAFAKVLYYAVGAPCLLPVGEAPAIWVTGTRSLLEVAYEWGGGYLLEVAW